MAYMSGYEQEYLGVTAGQLITSGAKAVPVVGGVISAIGGLFGGNSKDPGRLQSNAQAYGDAVAGDPSAVTYLKARSGRFGTIPITPPWHGDPDSPLGGWATSTAKDDAFMKYNSVSALAAPTSVTSYGATVPTTTKPVVAGMSQNTLIMLGIAGAGIYLLSQNKKKRRAA